MGWTEERTELLKGLWAEGLSASQIAGRLGAVTRNAVIGKVHRIGLARRAGPQWRMSSHGLPRGPRQTFPHRRPPLSAAPKPARVARPMPSGGVSAVVAAPEPSVRVALLDLSDDACRWPYGDPKRDFGGFCGREADGSYCDDHARLAY
jgi:GcrA cell cycle regulator